ncbi:hypothetical protein Fcan01_19118 [Folsomia candida]|uniref:Uncharacterized protein n=1 Tax=Folsomia candida TaxID=158441 RepID=A0A226DMP8_FOLCA|nr:hypothetical protein Fcan01_19118 [Folsomia candida]
MNSLREFAENVALKQRTRILSDFVVILVSNSHRIRDTNSDLVQAERENIYSEQVFEEDLEEIEVGKIVINSYMFIEFKTKSRRLTGEIDIRFSIDSLSNRRTFPFDISSNLSRKLEIRGEFDIDVKANVISKHKRIQSELLSGT